jgi:hypothetical protein
MCSSKYKNGEEHIEMMLKLKKALFQTGSKKRVESKKFTFIA